MKILALDPATHCGFAHSCGVSGTWDLSIRRDESSGMRLIRLRGKLNEILTVEGIDLVVYEAARHGAAKMQGALVVQAELQGVIKVWCQDHDVEYRAFSPKEIKRHAVGRGNASKQEMVVAARRKFDDRIFDDDQADALWILDLAKHTLTIS
jgi:Holliday junction resolvasome RuvABC endonuclease subunit